MGNSRGAATRKWNREMDKSKYLLLIGAKVQSGVVGLGVLGDGRRVTVSPGKPGRVAIMIHDPIRLRTFGLMQIDEMREWVVSGGELAREQNRKALNAAAPDLLSCLELHLAWYDGKIVCGSSLIKKTRAAIAKAKGQP